MNIMTLIYVQWQMEYYATVVGSCAQKPHLLHIINQSIILLEEDPDRC
jgi:hypothetical protein